MNDIKTVALALKKLSKIDPLVELQETTSGQYVIAAAGEIHMERCIKDLNELYCPCEIKVSDPIIEFRESVRLSEG